MDIYAIPTIGQRIAGNSYVGRGLSIGTTADGKCAAIAYFIMGRSANSRNRVFILRDGVLQTAPFDASKVADPSLIIYNALKVVGNNLIVTNGDQTDTIEDGIMAGKTFSEALESRCFEPDKPNFTPRISGMATFGEKFTYELSVLKSLDADGTDCARYTFSYPSKAGLGHFIHTYVCDGAPAIPSFQGEPERIAIPNDIDEFTADLWNNLDENNKISLYVRYMNLENGTFTDKLINKYN